MLCRLPRIAAVAEAACHAARGGLRRPLPAHLTCLRRNGPILVAGSASSSSSSTALICSSPIGAFSATCATQRAKSTYHNLDRRVPGVLSNTKKRKQFNYLSKSRMLPKPRMMTGRAARRRDDRTLRRRNEFKKQLARDVEEKIRFYPPFATKFVFFPPIAGSTRTILFPGNRDVGIRTQTRLIVHVADQLKKREHRPFLLEKMRELKVEPPTAEEWRRYTDPETGDINIGVLLPQWQQQSYIVATREALREDPKKFMLGNAVAEKAYLMLHGHDHTLVPTLEDWSHDLGPLHDSELFSTTRRELSVRFLMRQAKAEILSYGRGRIQAAIGAMALEDQMRLIAHSQQHRYELAAQLAARNLFITKFKGVLQSLPEIKAITSPRELHMAAKVRRHTIAQNGAFFPVFKLANMSELKPSKAQHEALSAFGYRYESLPTTGQKLYLRFCSRDYGLSVHEAASRFNRLTELQKAAVAFPFYMPITPASATSAAWRRFYIEMCFRYGLQLETGPILANRIFESAMRKRWAALPAEERLRYEEVDRVTAVFPLVRPGATASAEAEKPPESADIVGDYFEEEAAGKPELPNTASVDVKDAETADGNGEDAAMGPEVPEVPPSSTNAAETEPPEKFKAKTPAKAKPTRRRTPKAGATTSLPSLVKSVAVKGTNERKEHHGTFEPGLRVIMM